MDKRLQLSGACWTISGGDFLLQGVEVAWPHTPPAEFMLPGGRILRNPSAFYRVSRAGELVHTFAPPYAYSLEDTLYILDIRAVVDAQLREFLWVWRWKNEPEIEETKVLLTGLEEYAWNDLPFDPRRIPAPPQES